MTPIQFKRDDPSEKVEEATYYVLGGGHVGFAVAQRLQADGHTVKLVDESYDPSELSGRQGDPADVQTLEDAGVAAASTVVVAAQSDHRSLLIAQLVRVHFDVPQIVVLVNLPSRLDLLTEAGHEPVCATTALSDALIDTI